MDRLALLTPALVVFAIFVGAFAIYCVLCATGRAPNVGDVKHNKIFGPFFARFLVWLLGPVERLLVGRVSPNAITVLSMAMCAATGIAVAVGDLSRGVWLFAVAGVLDVLDGRLARLTHRETPAGALLDSVSDRWGELFVFTGFAWLLHDSPWLFAVMGAVAGSMMVSYTRARAEGLGLQMTGGWMQRAERIVLVTAGMLVAAWVGVGDESLIVPILGVTMAICGVSSTVTAVHRWIVAYRELARRRAEETAMVAPGHALGSKPRRVRHVAPGPGSAIQHHGRPVSR